MPPREEFSTKGLEGAPSNDIGWHFRTPVPNAKGNIVCKLCGKVVKGGITRFKEHIAHKTGNVTPCPNVTGVIRESMMNILKESNKKKIDKKRRKDEFLSQLREEEDEHEEFIDEVSAIRQATREKGRSSHGSAREYHRERTSKSISSESEFTLRGAIPELVKSKSSKQPKVNDPFLKSFRRKIEVGQGVKLPTPYEVSGVYLETEYQRVRDWVNELKTHWKELGATLMCDDVSSVHSRDAEFYYSLLDSVVEEIEENYIVQIVTDNEVAMKAAGKKLLLKRKHQYWTSCVAHYLDLCLEDIEKKPSVAKVLDEAKKLEEITRQKQGLREMFNSKEFKESKWGQQKLGPAYEAKKIVLGKDFWKKANDLIKVYEPLGKVFRLVDSDEKPTMSFIYEAIDRAK
ncbi:hypothetical protein CXB51_010385 [Gossypium anomalum]|uniref:BED-type domain-containing protein n=1 Tax=Gossypium anomalum TaxID=47600 RepID=A0A8J5ZD24_9ROSI|nr:hypothetical protein CXB51_010385 [Gossypium anomalum]